MCLAWSSAQRETPLLETDQEVVYFEVRGESARRSGRHFLVSGRIGHCSEVRFAGARVVIELDEDPGESGPMVLSGFGNFEAPKPGVGGAFDERSWFRREGWIARIKPVHTYKIDYLGRGFLGHWKQALLDRLARTRLGPFPKRLAAALIFGEGRALTKDDRAPFAATGTAHVLAVSGLHVGMVFGLLSILVLLVPSIRMRRPFRAVFIACGLLGYSWLTGFSPSVVRSSIMFTGWMISMTLERDRYSLNGLWLAALLSLVIWPRWIFSAGFHLSYAAVSAILLGFKKWELPDHWPIWAKRIGAMVQVTLFAQLGTMAVSWYYFELFPVYFLPANLLFTPLVALLLYGSWLTLAFSFAPGGAWVVYLYDGAVEYYQEGLSAIARLPFSVVIKKLTLLGLSINAMISWALILRIKKAKSILLGLFLLVIWRCCFWFL